MSIRSLFSHLRDLSLMAFPRNCVLCTQPLTADEDCICFTCIDELPETGYYTHADNPVAQQFWGRVPLIHATAYLYAHDGNMVLELIHQLKYQRKTNIGIKLGRLYGYKLSLPDSLITGVDLIVPVPLHKNKQASRGYNQCDYIAQGISEMLHVPVANDVMIRVIDNVSQTKHSRYERWGNVEGIFQLVQPDVISGRHILLIDDVVTTGATIESCAHTLLSGQDVRLSVATLATAGR